MLALISMKALKQILTLQKIIHVKMFQKADHVMNTLTSINFFWDITASTFKKSTLIQVKKSHAAERSTYIYTHRCTTSCYTRLGWGGSTMKFLCHIGFSWSVLSELWLPLCQLIGTWKPDTSSLFTFSSSLRNTPLRELYLPEGDQGYER